jgi:hypothetical protein
MNNDDVIDNLKKIIEQLETRITELNDLRNDPTVPFDQRPIRQNQIIQRTSSLNLRILQLEQQLHDRELLRSLNADVLQLSSSRKEKLEKALAAVSQDISTTHDFQAAISLAKKISDAASNAGEAVKL